MSTAKNGGAAFPRLTRDAFQNEYSGMTLRDWFAGQALAGHYANWGERSAREIARLSYTMADAMLEARDNG